MTVIINNVPNIIIQKCNMLRAGAEHICDAEARESKADQL